MNAALPKENILVNSDGHKTIYRSWTPENAESQIVLVHGFAEHMRYYYDFGEQLSRSGYQVHMFDLPGHGLSGGVRGHIGDFNDYVELLDYFIHSNPNFSQSLPTFLIGHSMGGLISSLYCLRKRPAFKGVILASPLLGFNIIQSLPARILAKALTRVDADHPVPKPFGVHALSRDLSVQKKYYQDPLRLNCISPMLYLSMLRFSDHVRQNAVFWDLPILIFSSSADTVVSPAAIEQFYSSIQCRDKELIVFTRAMHELFQEKEKQTVVDKILSWTRQRARE